MGKIRKNQAGFSPVEVILVLAIVGLIGVVGFMVYKNYNKTSNSTTMASTANTNTSTQTKSAMTPDPYAGWQSYIDSHVSFRYPSGWQAGADKRVAGSVSATSPGFTTSSMTTTTNPGALVTLFLQLSTNSATVYCSNDPCKVTAVVPLANSQLHNSELAVVNQTSGNGTNYSQYVIVSNGTKVGDTTINAIKAGNSSTYVFGQPYYKSKDGGLTIAARVTDTNALQADSHFKDLVNLINSIKFD